jgi:DNA primase
MTDRIESLHADLEAGVAALIDSESWQTWLDTAAKFHTYSFNNQMLIMLQCSNATHVAGYRAWQALGRQVRKGERSIGILAPNTRKIKDDVTGEESRRITGYRVASVFDISQTDGEPLPVQPRPALLQGEAPEGLWDAIASMITSNGYTLERGDTGKANGYTNTHDKIVRVSDTLTNAQATKTLIHECAHMILHDHEEFDYAAHRGIAEVEAESVAFIVGNVHGLVTDAYSMPYVAGWGKDASVVAATATRVIKTSRDILKVTNL